jgi:hypothetical protein
MQRLDEASLADAQEISFDFERKTKRLELICEWRDELRQRLARAIDDAWSPAPDLEELNAEVERFKLACRGAR